MSSKDILDAMIRAGSSRGRGHDDGGQARSFLHDALEAFGGGSVPSTRSSQGQRSPSGPWGRRTDETAGGGAADAGLSFEDLASRAKEAIGRNPGLAQAALLGVGGLLLSAGKRKGIGSGLSGLGGLALISGLAYRALQNVDFGQLSGTSTPQPRERAPAAERRAIELHPTRATDADALLFLRAMIAAVTADGHVDERERGRITAAFAQLGLDAEQARWLDQELGNPAKPEDLAAAARTPEKAAQVYAAARLAAEPDTREEREFLRRLAGALGLDDRLKNEIDQGASGLKVEG